MRDDPTDEAGVVAVVRSTVGVRQPNAAAILLEDGLVTVARGTEEAGEDIARIPGRARAELVAIRRDARRIDREICELNRYTDIKSLLGAAIKNHTKDPLGSKNRLMTCAFWN